MEKKLVVTASYGNLKFEEEAYPYNPNTHDEQYETCISSIYEQIKNDGKYEMIKAFSIEHDILDV
jgi:hypothetical protein